MNKKRDFNDWNKLKKKIDSSKSKKFFEERDVFWISLGINVGDEQNGKNMRFERPVLILKKFNKEVFVGLPITSKIKDNKFHYIFKSEGRKYSVVLSQIRLLSSKRLLKKRLRVEKEIFEEIKEKLKDIIF
jgi:mRNA interferase MazF